MDVHANVSQRHADGWSGFEFRPGDIVISTYPKSGTTWVQMICALLVFQTSDLPAPLSDLSPWLDHELGALRDDIRHQLTAQTHRRFIKTHSPLDRIPLLPEVTYLVTVRNPLDIRVSLEHQFDNLDHRQIDRLSGAPRRPAPPPIKRGWFRPTVREILLSWIDSDHEKESLRAVVKSFAAAWERRDQPNVVLVHYDDLSADLGREMRRLADRLAISIPDARWDDLVEAATFRQMREHADHLIPDPEFFKDPKAFFRQGGSGAWQAHLSAADHARYRTRLAALAPPDLVAWLHRDADG